MRKESANRSLAITRLFMVLCVCLSSTVLFAAPNTVTKELQKSAQLFLINYIDEHHVVTGREGLAAGDTSVNNDGSIKVSFVQTIDGVPVDGSGLSVYMDASAAKAQAVNGDFLPAGTERAIDLIDGKTAIIDALARKGVFYPALISKPTLVFVKASNTAVPAWRARAFYTLGRVRQVKDIYVNAKTGGFLGTANLRDDAPEIGANHVVLAANNIADDATNNRMNPDAASDSDSWFGPAPMPAILEDCANDVDADCLNDNFEDWIGARLAPVMFYDEDESCVAGIQADFRGVTDENQYDRKDFFQVRPQYANVADWKADDGKVKKIRVSYIFAYPHDCQTPAFGLFGGHQGDIEKVHFTLQSTDLRSWDLVDGHYRYHSDGKTVSGDIIKAFAEELGLDRPIIAVSEGSHASYFGKWTDARSSICDPHEAHHGKKWGISFVIDDCFCKLADGSNGSPQECLYEATQEQGRWINLADSLLANVGEPEQLRLGDFLQADARGLVYTEFDIGHGPVREYWSEEKPNYIAYGGFCGWECPNDLRVQANECAIKIHGEKKCVGPLSGKLDKGFFSLGPLETEDPKPNPCNQKVPQPAEECDGIINHM